MTDLALRLWSAIRGFLSWWITELKGLLPERLRKALFPPPKVLLVDLDGRTASFWWYGHRGGEPLGELDLQNAAPGDLQTLLQGHQLHSARVVIRLPQSSVLLKTFDFPDLPERDMRQALLIEMDRQTPFPAELVRFDWRVLERKPGARNVRLQLAIVPRERLAEIMEPLKAVGLRPDRVDVAEREAGAVSGFNLLPREAGTSRARFWSPVNLGLAGLALVLLAANIALPVSQLEAEAKELRLAAEEKRRAAAEVISMRQQAEALRSAIHFAVEAREQIPLVVSVLAELSRIVPADTWAYEVSIRGREVRLEGFAPSASSLVGLIDRSPLFADPAFRAPVTRDQRVGKERFPLTFTIQGGGDE